MKKTFLYRATINKQTETNCLNWLYLCRTLYNNALEHRILLYKQNKKHVSCFDQIIQLPEVKKVFPEFKNVGSQVLQDVLERLDKAFKSFFNRNNAGFPRFRAKDRYDSFTLKQTGWKLEGRYLYIKNVGRFKLFLSRPIEGKIKTVTIRKFSTGKWFVSFSCDSVPEKQIQKTNAEVGIDVGIKSFCVDSEGNQIQNPKFLKESLKRLRVVQRSLSRKKRGSSNRQEAKRIVAKTHEKISNQRKDFLHKTANFYIENFDTIYIENLNIKGMVRNRHLSRSIADSSWGIFFNLLSYKAECAGKTLIKVAPHNTSQNCSGCGEKVPKSLSVRIHNCPFCGLVLDRDHNAALNILTVGQTVQALSTLQGSCLRIPCL